MIKAIRDGREVYHWPASLKELIQLRNKYGYINQEPFNLSHEYANAHYDALKASEDWQMCACGSLCRAIPRRKTSGTNWCDPTQLEDAPKDKPLANLGLKFMTQVQKEDFEAALKTMDEIEARATIVLNKLGKKPKKYGKPRC
jgi:hypothetical protein